MDENPTPHPHFGPHVAAIAALLGLVVAIWLSANDLMNVYGDGVAHLNIARKVVDAAPGTPIWSHYVQLGSPWLPVQHVLMLPFVWIDSLWRSGWAGAIPSLACFVVAVWCTYRLAFDLFEEAGDARENAALCAAATVGLSPSVLAMAAMPMTEVPFLAVLVASTWTLLRWTRDGRRTALLLSGFCVAVATMTRYEGWALVPAGFVVVALCARGSWADRGRDVALWALAASAGIAYWLWHNHAIAGDPLEFVRGPYSARAVFERANLGWAAVTVGRPFKSLGWALVTIAVVAGPAVVAMAMAGAISRVIDRGRGLKRDLPAANSSVPFALKRDLPAANSSVPFTLKRDLPTANLSVPFAVPAAILSVPFAFLVFSLFRGEVQIAPFAAVALLNVRYGVPHVALLGILVGALVVRFAGMKYVAPAVIAVVAAQNVWLLSDGFSQLAVCQEAIRNSRNSSEWQQRDRVAAWLEAHPPDGRTLLHSGDLGPVVPRSGLTFARIVHDGSPAWGEWVASGQLPGDVSTVVARRDDEVMRRLASDTEFEDRFVESFASGPFVVFTRR